MNRAAARVVSEGDEGVTPMTAEAVDRVPGGRAWTRYLVVLTEVRPLSEDGGWRDERSRPERRRQVVGAVDRAAAERIAAAFRAFGMVRAGRQRVKIIAVEPG